MYLVFFKLIGVDKTYSDAPENVLFFKIGLKFVIISYIYFSRTDDVTDVSILAFTFLKFGQFELVLSLTSSLDQLSFKQHFV